MTSANTIILLIVDYHAAIGGKTPCAPLRRRLSTGHDALPDTQPIEAKHTMSPVLRSRHRQVNEPASQRLPVSPGGHEHCPVTGLHSAELEQLHVFSQ